MAVSGDWTYTESEGNATITDYSGSATPTIPTSLDGYPVIGIGANALKSKSLISVTIEHAINLDDECFANNSGLTVTLDADVTTSVTSSVAPFEGCSIGSNLIITENVTTIPDLLFFGCGLTAVTLPNSLTAIGNSSFDLNSLTSLTLPSSLTSIGTWAFSSNSLSSITLDHTMNLDDGCFGYNGSITVTLDADITTSVSANNQPFKNCTLGSNLTITENVTTIPGFLFYNCGLTAVTLPSSLTTIENNAFDLNSLISINLPNSLTSIGAWAFSSNSLSSINIDHVINLDDGCFGYNGSINVTLDANITTSITLTDNAPFKGCTLGSNLTITENVTTIPDILFSNCGLTAVTLPDSLTTIGRSSFDTNSLTSITLPNSLTSIGAWAFSLNSISSITLDHVMNLDDGCFGYNGSITVILDANITTSIPNYSNTPFYNCTIGSGLTITENVTTLPNYLFCNCGLTSVVVPNTITAFGSNQFSYNTNLANIYIYSLSFTSSSTLENNMSVETPGTIYGYAGSSAQTLADGYATYNFSALIDITVNMDVGLITFSGKEPIIQSPITVNMDVGLITFSGKGITKNTTVNMDAGLITFSGKDITTTGGEVEIDSNDGIDLFLLADFI
jgi:hypothetical protein